MIRSSSYTFPANCHRTLIRIHRLRCPRLPRLPGSLLPAADFDAAIFVDLDSNRADLVGDVNRGTGLSQHPVDLRPARAPAPADNRDSWSRPLQHRRCIHSQGTMVRGHQNAPRGRSIVADQKLGPWGFQITGKNQGSGTTIDVKHQAVGIVGSGDTRGRRVQPLHRPIANCQGRSALQLDHFHSSVLYHLADRLSTSL